MKRSFGRFGRVPLGKGIVLFLPQILDKVRGGKIKDEFADSGAEV